MSVLVARSWYLGVLSFPLSSIPGLQQAPRQKLQPLVSVLTSTKCPPTCPILVVFLRAPSTPTPQAYSQYRSLHPETPKLLNPKPA